MLDTIIADDFMWSAIQSHISGRIRQASTDFIGLNCPVCHLYGESRDTRKRCGVKRNPDGVGVNCFNCGFKARFSLGKNISKRMRSFLSELGASDREISQLNLKAMQYRRMIGGNENAQSVIPIAFQQNYQEVPLPNGAKSFIEWAESGCVDPDFIDVVDYLFSRGDDISKATTYYWTPDTEKQMNRRVIIPFYHRDKIVGWTGRIVDPVKEGRFSNSSPPNYLFNNHTINSDRQFVIVCEGPFDALAVDGVATLGAKINPEQIRWLKNNNQTVIVVPDRDAAGDRLIDKAMENNWKVSFPKLKTGHGTGDWWDDDIKDLADAVKRYGRLYTVRSVIETATDSKAEISIKRTFLY